MLLNNQQKIYAYLLLVISLLLLLLFKLLLKNDVLITKINILLHTHISLKLNICQTIKKNLEKHLIIFIELIIIAESKIF